MNLKQAKAKNKIDQFIKEREQLKQPPGHKARFKQAVKSMALRKKKPVSGTSA